MQFQCLKIGRGFLGLPLTSGPQILEDGEPQVHCSGSPLDGTGSPQPVELSIIKLNMAVLISELLIEVKHGGVDLRSLVDGVYPGLMGFRSPECGRSGMQ